MNKGGYQIIDLKNKLFASGASMVYPGVYELIDGTRKPLLISGLYFNGVEYQDFFCTPILNGSEFEINNSDYSLKIIVGDSDTVTITGY